MDIPTPSGERGNLKTIDVMIKWAKNRCGHPLVRDLATTILSSYNVRSQDYLTEAKCIGDFVHKNVRYVRDAVGIEQLTDPVYMIKKIFKSQAQGDCDDMSLLIATLLLSIGCQPYFRAVRYKADSGPYNHIYVIVYEQNRGRKPQRFSIDAIVKHRPIGFEVPHRSGKEFPVS